MSIFGGTSIIPALGGGGVTDHGALTGLGDDDHPQYLLANGTRALAGTWSLGGQTLSSLGAIGTGTPTLPRIVDLTGTLSATGAVTEKLYSLAATFASGVGAANQRVLAIEYTINHSGAQTGIATGLYLNATETALQGQTHHLADLCLGGSTRFRVMRNGYTYVNDGAGQGAYTFGPDNEYSRGGIAGLGLGNSGLRFLGSNWGYRGSVFCYEPNIGGTGVGNTFQIHIPSNYHRATAGTERPFFLNPKLASAAGSAVQRVCAIEYEIAHTGAQTGTATGLYLNATETALQGQAHVLADLCVGGVRRFAVERSGLVDVSGVAAGSPVLRITATTDVPTTTWTATGGIHASAAPAGYLEVEVGGTARYIPFWS